tara:strand:+ start:31 stop:555 length:525 start_codon:yes stop_codon:yes gene_type:complete
MKLNYIILILSLTFINGNVFGQAEKFGIKNGDIEPLVQSVNGMKSDSIYSKSNEWINYNFKKADAVIGSSIDNKMIRFTGINPNFAKSFGYIYDLEFTIRIEFKENRYRLTVENLRSGNNGIFANFNFSDYYKSNGEPRKAYKDFVIGIENTLNNLNQSIYNYMTGKTEKKDDW